MSIFDGLHPYFFRRMMEKTQSMKEEMDGEVYIPCQSRHFAFVDDMIKVIFPICTLNWRVNSYASRQRKGIKKRNESIILIINFLAFGTVKVLLKTLTVCFD